MKHTTHEFTILIDSREQKPLAFPNILRISPDTTCRLSTRIAKLDGGDYAVEGYEQIVGVERKGSIHEILRNFTDPNDAKRQGRALSRFTSGTRFPILLLETPIWQLTEHGEIFMGLGRALQRFGPFSLIFASSLGTLSGRRIAGELVAALMTSIVLEEQNKNKIPITQGKSVDIPVVIGYNSTSDIVPKSEDKKP